MPHRYDASDAKRDIATKSSAQIERESANKWFRLALECYRKYAEAGELQYLLDGEAHRQEALEHAAQTGDGGKLVGVLDRRMARVRPRIPKVVRKTSRKRTR